MHLEPINQIKLYGLSNFFWELSNLFDQQKLPNKILLSGKKGIGKATLAFHLTNYILSINEDNSYNKNELAINKTNRAYTLVNDLEKQYPDRIRVFWDKETGKSVKIGKSQFINLCNPPAFRIRSTPGLIIK